ncbi:MAG TPA: hypothetical protein VK610_09210 [Rhodothermales bacterium]|nr:hypothetical protein [Rhodothermales bacterium]
MRTFPGILAATLTSLAVPLAVAGFSGDALDALVAFAPLLAVAAALFAVCHGLGALAARRFPGHPVAALLAVSVLGSGLFAFALRLSSSPPPGWPAAMWVAAAAGVALLLGSAVHYAVSLRHRPGVGPRP